MNRHFYELARNIVETVNSPLLTLDSDLNIIFANSSFCQTFQFKLEDIEGGPIESLFSGQLPIPELWGPLERVLSNNIKIQDLQLNLSFVTVGPRRPLVNISQIVDEKYKSKFVLLAFYDISEPENREEDLIHRLADITEDRNRLNTLIDTITDEIWVFDAEGKLVLANPAAIRAFGVAFFIILAIISFITTIFRNTTD